MAKGSTSMPYIGHRRQISIYFDAETFEEINTLATKKKLSFAEMVRDLVEWGLMDLREGTKK